MYVKVPTEARGRLGAGFSSCRVSDVGAGLIFGPIGEQISIAEPSLQPRKAHFKGTF